MSASTFVRAATSYRRFAARSRTRFIQADRAMPARVAASLYACFLALVRGEIVSAALTLEEYEARAISRLEQIDALTPRCQWEKFDHQCDDITLTLRAKWKRLMDEQGRDEVAAGL